MKFAERLFHFMIGKMPEIFSRNLHRDISADLRFSNFDLS